MNRAIKWSKIVDLPDPTYRRKDKKQKKMNLKGKLGKVSLGSYEEIKQLIELDRFI